MGQIRYTELQTLPGGPIRLRPSQCGCQQGRHNRQRPQQPVRHPTCHGLPLVHLERPACPVVRPMGQSSTISQTRQCRSRRSRSRPPVRTLLGPAPIPFAPRGRARAPRSGCTALLHFFPGWRGGGAPQYRLGTSSPDGSAPGHIPIRRQGGRETPMPRTVRHGHARPSRPGSAPGGGTGPQPWSFSAYTQPCRSGSAIPPRSTPSA